MKINYLKYVVQTNNLPIPGQKIKDHCHHYKNVQLTSDQVTLCFVLILQCIVSQ